MLTRRRHEPRRPAEFAPESLQNERRNPFTTRQMDLFGESHPELSSAESAAAVYRADPDEVRAELLRVLAKARAAESFPWIRAARSVGAPFFRR
jgi:hypothetical protein